MKVEVPIRIESTPNLRESWQARSKRTGKHKHDTWFALKAARPTYSVPCTVTITRVAPRTLDSDNHVSGCKGIRDAIALWLRVDDADERVTWLYTQRKGGPKQYSCEITIESAV